MQNKVDKKIYQTDSFLLFIKTLIRVMIICAIFGIFYGTYFVAEETFSNPAYNSNGKQAIEIVVTKSDSDKEVAEQLKKKKLIYGTYRFLVRKHFSKFRNKTFLAGKYQFYQSQGMDDIMAVLCGEQETKEILQ